MNCSITQNLLPNTAAVAASSFPSRNQITNQKTRQICLRRRSRRCNPRMSIDKKTPPPNNPNNLITSVSKLLWGKSLPPSLLISTVRTAWSTIWHLMMSQLAPSDPSGGYTRPASQFRVVQPDSPKYTALKPGSLHLYVGIPCPWAHRTLIVRALKGLENAISISVASPGVDGSWVFQSDPNHPQVTNTILPTPDKVNGSKTLREVYNLRRGGYSGRSTVPMLWDIEKRDVLCNESYDIIQILNSGLNHLALNPDINLSPPQLSKQIDEWNQLIYPNINNGVYRCGFAQSQEAYDKAVTGLFTALDMVDDHLGKSRYLCGDVLTLADVCLFTTLIRFDLVYNVMFKCTKKKIVEYANVHAYMCDIYRIPNVAETCNFEATMDGYYKFLFPLNPGGIRPVMPSGSEHQVLWRVGGERVKIVVHGS